MKYILLTLFAFTFLLSACTNPSEKNSSKPPADLKTTIQSFSDTAKMDTFKVVLQGKRPKDMLLTFSITAFDGKEIYKKELKGRDLIDNYKETLDLSKENSQRDFIMDEFNLFFDEENFLWPALTAEQTPDKYATDKTFFQELQQSNLNGFKYRVSKETNIYIAWSEQEKKVKVYYKCC
ncbi:hypothetical protein [Pedobacter immunditicola]|uniref:hypothetical protein n=1 Tax=Pedobacter immunditicola TaxID=3133440 RepID=UPI0030AA328F